MTGSIPARILSSSSSHWRLAATSVGAVGVPPTEAVVVAVAATGGVGCK